MLADTAWITESNKRNNAKEVLIATSSIYSDSEMAIILRDDLDTLGNSFRSLIYIKIKISIVHMGERRIHVDECDTYVFPACKKAIKLEITLAK